MHTQRPTCFNFNYRLGNRASYRTANKSGWRKGWWKGKSESQRPKRPSTTREKISSVLFVTKLLISSYTEVNVCHSGRMVMAVDMRNGWEWRKEFSTCSTLAGFSPCQWWLFLLSCWSCSSARSSDSGVGEEWQLERAGISWSRCRSGRWCGGHRMLAGWSLWLTVAGQWAHLHQPLFNHKENIYNSKDFLTWAFQEQ